MWNGFVPSFLKLKLSKKSVAIKSFYINTDSDSHIELTFTSLLNTVTNL